MFAAALRQELLDNGITSTVMSRPPFQFDEALEIICGENTFTRRIWIGFLGSIVKIRMSGGSYSSICDLTEPDSIKKVFKEIERYQRLAMYMES